MLSRFFLLGDSRYPILDKIRSDLTVLYRDLDEELRRYRHPECETCGQCCCFTEWGHELWVTQFELDLLISEHGLRRPTGEGVCPYLSDGLCQARSGRALSCRIFTCKGDQSELESVHEKYLSRLRELARSEGLDIYYGELLTSLAEIEFENV